MRNGVGSGEGDWVEKWGFGLLDKEKIEEEIILKRGILKKWSIVLGNMKRIRSRGRNNEKKGKVRVRGRKEEGGRKGEI